MHFFILCYYLNWSANRPFVRSRAIGDCCTYYQNDDRKAADLKLFMRRIFSKDFISCRQKKEKKFDSVCYLSSRVPLTFSTLWYQWGLLTIVVVMCEGSKTGFRIFLSITKIRPGHFEVGGFTVVKSKNWPPLIFLKLKFSYINQGPWTWIKRNYINISHRKKVYLVTQVRISGAGNFEVGH